MNLEGYEGLAQFTSFCVCNQDLKLDGAGDV